MKTLFVSCRSASFLLEEDGLYELKSPVCLYLDGEEIGEENRSVCSVYGLQPDRAYTLTARRDGVTVGEIAFRTLCETYTLDVRRFGARGDGETEDTQALQAAILCCPENGRVLIPEGNYVTGPLFLKSHITIEFRKGATLSLLTDRKRFPILPGTVFPSVNADDECLLSLWEGNPLDAFASAITGIHVEDVHLIGEGIIDGRAQQSDWWDEPKKRIIAFRGRLFYLYGCRDIHVQGLTFRNSPAWNVHPTFSENLGFYNIRVEAPAVSPNTDGFDPESCAHVRLLGARFSVGDDCIAIKSGKIYLGRKYHTPSEDIEIAWCAMLDGHGGVTVGSEMAGGVRHVRVHHCLMRGNDRGLRVKTRRGRGKNAVIDDIRFEDVRMDGVKVPLVVNSMYFCDPDGHSPYVQSLEKQPVDDNTPTVGSVTYERVKATGCQACVAYLLGLPERPVGKVTMRDCEFDFAEETKPMVPAMAENVPAMEKRGIISRFVSELVTENVRITGIRGDEVSGG